MEDQLSEGQQRKQGIKAQEANIYIAKMVASIVKTTLGPRGMDKLLVDHLGDVTVTNDGVTILREMTIENPIAKMMVEIAKTQETEVGDGTTTAVVIAGELLDKARELINKKIHPTIIAKGYKIATEEAIKYLHSIAKDLEGYPTKERRKILESVARTAMTGKGSEEAKEKLAKVVVDAAIKIKGEEGIDPEDIKVEKKEGGSIEDTKIIEGIIVDRGREHPNMPRKVEKAKIAVISDPIETKSLDIDARININNPEEMKAFLEEEARQIKELVETIKKSGANVVFCARNIDDTSNHFLAKEGIYAVRRIPKEDIEKIAKATGATITTVEDLTPEKLGKAGIVREETIGLDKMTFIEECPNAKSVTIFVRGSTEQITAETKRAVEDALGDVITILKDNKIIGGAGAPEILLSQHLKQYARKHKGRIQLAVEKFSEALEVIPETLAENAGLDPIDVITEMKSSLIEGNPSPGIDVFENKVINSFEEGIIEPLKVKTQAITSASEVAQMVLRIDDVIAIMFNPDEKKAQAEAMKK